MTRATLAESIALREMQATVRGKEGKRVFREKVTNLETACLGLL